MTNARFEDLEKRVKGIKLKKYIKLIVLLAILFGVGFYLLLVTKPNIVKKPLHVEKVIKKEPVKKTPKIQKSKPNEKEIKVEKNDYDTMKLSPKISFTTIKKQKIIEKKEPIEVEKKPTLKKNKISLHVKEVKSEDALLERFRAAGDFESSIALARLYFKKQNFEKSIYWSKKASKLSSSKDTAWLIYAKSKRAIGKKNDAIEALQLYLEYFSSNEVKKLLKLYREKQ